MVLLWIVIPLFIFYSFIIIYFWLGWRSVPTFMPTNDSLSTKISVIVPARNEERNIACLLETLLRQTYPKSLTELIVVDDHSEDQTATIAGKFPGVKVLPLTTDSINSYKKKAIELGVSHATGELIVTTDADCVPEEHWLQVIASFKQKTNAVFIAAPVVIDCSNSLVQVFQAMDFMVLQGITGAAVYRGSLSMCNGANLAYEKKTFAEVNGFESIDHIASGDDMLLMHKIWKKYPHGVQFLKSKDAVVATKPVATWKDFFQQRIRWASKAIKYDDKRIVAVLVLVYLFNLSFLALFIVGFWNHVYWLAIGFLWLGKTLIELPLFFSLSNFFEKHWAKKWFFLFQPLHIIYTILSGFLGQFGKYKWKGRRVK